MASPREQVPDSGLGSTGNPILDSANALEQDSSSSNPNPFTLDNNKPAQSSPLKSSTITASDLNSTADPASGLVASKTADEDSSSSLPAPTEQTGTVENVLSAIGGVVATAPLAALEAIGQKLPAVVETVKAHAPHLPTGNASTSSTPGSNTAESLTHKVTQSGETLLHSAQNLANQAATYAQQGIHQIVEKLPESVTSKLPSQITSPTTSSTTTTSGGVAGIGKNLKGEALPQAATGKDAYDFTATHTTANFEASGSLQSTKNPALVEAQSDLAVKAESGDL